MSRKWQTFWLVVATLASLGGAAIGVIMAIMSPLVFDGPGNILNPLAWVAFLLIIGLWIVCILAPYGAWIAFLRRQTYLAWATMGAPLLWTIALAMTSQFVPV